jgi:hypothetical protein
VIDEVKERLGIENGHDEEINGRGSGSSSSSSSDAEEEEEEDNAGYWSQQVHESRMADHIPVPTGSSSGDFEHEPPRPAPRATHEEREDNMNYWQRTGDGRDSLASSRRSSVRSTASSKRSSVVPTVEAGVSDPTRAASVLPPAARGLQSCPIAGRACNRPPAKGGWKTMGMRSHRNMEFHLK